MKTGTRIRKKWSLSGNCPQQIKMVILNGDLMRAAEAAFWRISSGKLFLNFWSILRKITAMKSNLSKVVPTTLLKLFFVMGDFLEVFQEFNINSYQYKKHLLGIASQACKWRRCDYGEVRFLCSYDCKKRAVSQKVPRKNGLCQVGQSKMKKLVNKIYFSLLFLSFAFVSSVRMMAHIYKRSQCDWRVELHDMMKSPLESSNIWYGLHKTKYNAFAFIGHATLRISPYYYRISTLFTLGCNSLHRWPITELGTSFIFVKAIKLGWNRFVSD